MSKRNVERLSRAAEKRRVEDGMILPAPTRRERRTFARQILNHSPGLIEKIAEEEGVSRSRAKQLAVRYIASGMVKREADFARAFEEAAVLTSPVAADRPAPSYPLDPPPADPEPLEGVAL